MEEQLVRQGRKEICKIQYSGRNNEKMMYFTFDSLTDTEIVEHFFSTRQGGVSKAPFDTLNFSYSRGDEKEAVDENFRRAAAVFHREASDIVCSVQTHTTNIRKVTPADKGKGVTRPRDYEDVDGLITNEAGIILATFYADCVPLFVVDTVHRAIGLSHSGWRGTVARMGRATLEAMAREYGTRPEDVRVVIAPSICQDCYEVSGDVALAFSDTFARDDDKAAEYLRRYKDTITEREIAECLLYQKNAAQKADGKYQLNLWYANFRVFRDAGVPDENIEITDVCTCCNAKLLFSHRASNGQRGNLGAFLMLA
ncbi:MAG: peptidoglycan editing factor PgeF [Roseburia sp.]|nr:peptidoglycan editing factor PgeF [Roseburia sp.]